VIEIRLIGDDPDQLDAAEQALAAAFALTGHPRRYPARRRRRGAGPADPPAERVYLTATGVRTRRPHEETAP
jgi:hypothetical protein